MSKKGTKFELITSDFNSLSQHDHEPESWNMLSSQYRSHYFDGYWKIADRTVLESLEAAGFVDCGYATGTANLYQLLLRKLIFLKPFRIL